MVPASPEPGPSSLSTRSPTITSPKIVGWRCSRIFVIHWIWMHSLLVRSHSTTIFSLLIIFMRSIYSWFHINLPNIPIPYASKNSVPRYRNQLQWIPVRRIRMRHGEVIVPEQDAYLNSPLYRFRNSCKVWDNIRSSKLIASYNTVLASQPIQ